MEWLYNLFVTHDSIQAVVILGIIVSLGVVLGKVKVMGVSLGATFVFFIGILAGHLGLNIDRQMLVFAENFGLVLFVYELGLQVGPGFFSSFQQSGYTLNTLSLAVIFLGTMLAIGLTYVLPIGLPDMMGILCGATTNTPALAAAQQTLKQMSLPTEGAALSCAVTYPLGVVGVILAIIVIRKLFVRPSELEPPTQNNGKDTFIATFIIHNPAIYGKSIPEIATATKAKFVISRIWREGVVSIPTSETVLQEHDRILVSTHRNDVQSLMILFGEQENQDWNKTDIDWNNLDVQLLSRNIVITRPEINGKKLSSLRLRNAYGINISRILRNGMQLLATPELILQVGDRLTIVGEKASIDKVEEVLGNTVKTLNEPNLASTFIGIILGLIIGSIPIMIPGINTPIKLGLAGGPIIVGILIGAFGPRLHMITYTTQSANLMLRGLGLSLYLACLGLDAGAHFFDTVMRPEGLLWIATGFVITIVPTILVGLLAIKMYKLDFGSTCGMLCGSMANPMALNYANDIVPNDYPSVSYTTVYPLGLFMRVIIAQLTLMFFI